MRPTRLLAALAALLLSATLAHALPPPDRMAVLRRGVNITNWFRYPPSQDSAAIRTYMSDDALADLRRAGFTFVRLPVQPEFALAAPERLELLSEAIGRIERAGLGVIVELHPTSWHIETADRGRLLAAWRSLAPVVARFDPRMTFPEIVNEPVFTDDSAGWNGLQREAAVLLRQMIPSATIVLTGNDWGSIDGLGRVAPVADPNVIYSFHFYEPRALVLLADWAPKLDKTALATLPYPVTQPCIRAPSDPATLALMQDYCRGRWNAARLRKRLAEAAAWGERNGVRVLMGEFGAIDTLNEPSRLAWLADTREIAEQLGFGWALWGYDDIMGFDIHRPPGPRPTLDPSILRALGLRPLR